MAVLAVRVVPATAIRRRERAASMAGVAQRLQVGFGLLIGARVEGVLWAARQYWLLFRRYA